ncbi:MAG TPA: O-antigen ligase family protein [Fimbriimonadaceae bacterium]|jgi:O-antigen ligase
MKKLDASLALLGIAAFLMPIMGGYVDVGSQPAPAGIATAISGLFGTDACTLAHALLGLLVTASLCMALFKRQVVQLPQPRIAVALGVVVVLTGFSIFLSSFRMLSLTTFAEWSLYAATLMTACTVVGRWEGPKIICTAFALGCTFLALGGMWEYVTQPDPTWRIFFHWQDPNALAGILVIGFFISIGLALISKRLSALGWVFAAALIATAILRTLSKGGLLGVFVGLLVLFIFIGFYGKDKLGSYMGRFLASVILVPVFWILLLSLQHSAPAQSKVAPATNSVATASVPPEVTSSDSLALGRVLNPAATAEQSAQFRINLWKGCLALIKENPIGWGMGTYRFESTRPGNTSETKLAHNSFLQLAVEAGPLAGATFIVLLALCAFEMLRGSRKLPENQNLLRSAIFAAILASCVHSVFDSDLYFAGIGFSFFLLIGVGLALSGDGIVPELLKGGGKVLWVGLPVFCTVLGIYAGVLQLKIEALLADFSLHTPDGMAQTTSDAESLRALCPMDYRVWYYSVPVALSPDEAKDFAKNAVDQGPTPVNYHRLAQTELRQHQPQAAVKTLTDSLKVDPNNLENLLLMMKTQDTYDRSAAAETARKMVAIEDTTYFKTRALPDIVPTETYEAREYLAADVKDSKEKIELLRPAVQGMLNYAATTVPMIIKMSSVGSQFGSPQDAAQKLTQISSAATDLGQAYRILNDEKDAKWADDAVATFKATLDSLGKTPTSSM